MSCARRNPHIGDLLGRLRLDKSFVRGEGSLLLDQDGTSYLDAVRFLILASRESRNRRG